MATVKRSQAFTHWFLARAGWTIVGDLPELPGMVCVVAPHTSNWDFFVGMIVAYTLDIWGRWPLRFFIKNSVLRWPVVGKILIKLGAIPIDRSASHDFVASTAERLKLENRFLLAITPEGTRKRTEYWKSGFYYIALTVGVPIVPVAFDYATRQCRFGEPIMPSGNIKDDMVKLADFYRDVTAKNPGQFGPVRIGNQKAV